MYNRPTTCIFVLRFTRLIACFGFWLVNLSFNCHTVESGRPTYKKELLECWNDGVLLELAIIYGLMLRLAWILKDTTYSIQSSLNIPFYYVENNFRKSISKEESSFNFTKIVNQLFHYI